MKEGKQCVFLEAKPRPKRSKDSRTYAIYLNTLIHIYWTEQASGWNGAKAWQPLCTSLCQHWTCQWNHSSANDRSNWVASYVPFWNSHTVSLTLSDLTSQDQSAIPRFLAPFPCIWWDTRCYLQGHCQLWEGRGINTLLPHESLQFSFHTYLTSDVTGYTSSGEAFPFTFDTCIWCSIKLQTSRYSRARASWVTRQEGVCWWEKIYWSVTGITGVSGMVSVNFSVSLPHLVLTKIRYHLYFNPDRQQVYQLSQMAIAMAIDLGINRKAQDPASMNNSVVSIPFSFPHVLNSRISPEEMENRRTFLGCYYISCW